MNLRLDLLVLSALAGILAVFPLAPAFLAVVWGEPIRPFALSLAVALALAALFWAVGRGSRGSMRPRDGYLVVTGGWILASFLAALPFYLSGATGAADAWFEAVSGITTTGSTILADIESHPASLGPIVILLTFGGMTGSTGGGIKSFRSLIALRGLRAALRKIARPPVVQPVAHQRRVVPAAVLVSCV